MKHYQVTFVPDHKTVRIHAGATLFEAAGQAGIILSTPCGGIGRCGKCRLELVPSGKEVLACQYTVESDLTARVPETSRFLRQQILEHGIQREVCAIPSVQKVFLQTFERDLNQFCKTLSGRLGTSIQMDKARQEELVSQLSTQNDGGVTAVVVFCTPADIETSPGGYLLSGIEIDDTTGTLYGLAIDIGTTTVVGRMIDFTSGQVVCSRSSGNPQTQYGADVISRISYSQKPDGPDRLQRSIITCLNELIHQTTHAAVITPHDIYDTVIVGNTTMNHLLRKLPVFQLGQAPYRAHTLAASDHRPSELGLDTNPAGRIHVAANIAGFVGSDTVAAAMACGLDLSTVNTLLVDIGTNGEIVLRTGSGLLAASCAAGPALEGAGIVFGSRAQSGAIERVVYDGSQIDVDVIESDCAHTICGSGLIDAGAVMLEAGIIDPTGRFYERHELNPLLPESIRRRLITIEDKPAFVLTGQYRNNQWEHAVYLTQSDIRQLQLAKAAIRTGIELLLRKAQISSVDIQQLFLAGAFGNYIQKESALRIGLLPDIPLEKIHFVGNAAGSGAQMALLSRDARMLLNQLARQIDYLEIAHSTDFQAVFSEYLFFPEK